MSGGPETVHTAVSLGSQSTVPQTSVFTARGRVRRGTKGKREHGCVFCGKVYTRREHLKRHQGKHRTGSFPCKCSDCSCTFHSAELLERHEKHEWPFTFPIPDKDLFECPSHPATSSRLEKKPQETRTRGSSRATISESEPITDSEEDAEYSPAPSFGSSASNQATSLDTNELSPRARYLDVPRRSPLQAAREARHIRRRSANRSMSSSAVMQNGLYTQAPEEGMPVFSLPPPEHTASHHMLQRHVSDTSAMHTPLETYQTSATALLHPVQGGEMQSLHSESIQGYQSTTNLFHSTYQSQQASSWQNAEPRFSLPVQPTLDTAAMIPFEQHCLYSDYGYIHNTTETRNNDYSSHPNRQIDLQQQDISPLYQGVGQQFVGDNRLAHQQTPQRHIHMLQRGASYPEGSTLQGLDPNQQPHDDQDSQSMGRNQPRRWHDSWD